MTQSVGSGAFIISFINLISNLRDKLKILLVENIKITFIILKEIVFKTLSMVLT